MLYTGKQKIAEIFGFKLLIPEDVYQPSDDSYLLAHNLVFKENDEALDLGCGCGLIALIAAEKAKKVVAIDINPSAVKACQKNVDLNGMEDKVQIRQGDLFQPLGEKEKFSIIVFNPPYLPSADEERKGELLEAAWNGGVNGRVIIDRFLSEVKLHLKPKGRIVMIQSTLSGLEQTISNLVYQNFSVHILSEKKLDFEKILCIEARLKA